MTKAEQTHKRRVAELGCMACRKLWAIFTPEVQLHHQRGGMGGWGKGDYRTLIPLCHAHHLGNEGVHGLGTKGFAKHYGFDELDMLQDVYLLLGENDGR